MLFVRKKERLQRRKYKTEFNRIQAAEGEARNILRNTITSRESRGSTDLKEKRVDFVYDIFTPEE